MPCAPVLDEFLKKDNLKVRIKNTARVRVPDHSKKSMPRVDPRIIDEFSSKTGEQGGPPEKDKIIHPGARSVARDAVFLTQQLKDTEISPLGKTGSGAEGDLCLWGRFWAQFPLQLSTPNVVIICIKFSL